MYLALLAGGQQLKTLIRRTIGLSGDRGTAIFVFPEGKHILKKDFKDTINALPLTRSQKDEIVVEKRRVFKLNNEIANQVKPQLASAQRLIKLVVFFLVALCVILYVLYRGLTWVVYQ